MFTHPSSPVGVVFIGYICRPAEAMMLWICYTPYRRIPHSTVFFPAAFRAKFSCVSASFFLKVCFHYVILCRCILAVGVTW